MTLGNHQLHYLNKLIRTVMTCRPFTFLILLAAICTFDSLLILKQCSPRISSHFRSSVKRSQAVKKTGATDISTPSYSRQNVHYCAACSTSIIGDEENLHTLRATLNRKRKMVKNKFLGLEVSLRTSKPFFTPITFPHQMSWEVVSFVNNITHYLTNPCLL